MTESRRATSRHFSLSDNVEPCIPDSMSHLSCARRFLMKSEALRCCGRTGFTLVEFLVRRLFHRLRQLRGDLFRPHEMDAAPEVVAAPRHATSRSALCQANYSPKRRNTWETGELIPIVRPNCHCGRRLRRNSRGELIACPAHDARACLHTSALGQKGSGVDCGRSDPYGKITSAIDSRPPRSALQPEVKEQSRRPGAPGEAKTAIGPVARAWSPL